MKRLLALWLPNWPIQRLLHAKPEIRGRAILLEAPARGGQIVAACSPEAQSAGVELEMPLAEAITILTSSPNPNPTLNPNRALPLPPHTEPYDPATDRRALHLLAQHCHRYTPTAGLEESDSPETLLLDATNLAPLYGSEQEFERQVTAALRRQGFTLRAALASTIGAAWALAHYGSNDECWEGEAPAEPRTGKELPFNKGATAGSPSSAEACTRDPLLDKPAVPPNETAALAALPIAALRLSSNLLETLHNLGADHIGDVLAFPRDQLRSRFGPELLTRLDQAAGTVRETFAAVEPAEEFAVEQLFDFPISDRELLHHVIESLLDRLAWMLAARCAGALRLACRFDCEGSLLKKGTGSRSIEKNDLSLQGRERACPLFQQAASDGVTIEVGLFQPTANPKHLFEILEIELERLRLRAPANAITIRVLRHAPLAERQHVLFDHERHLESSRPLATLINRLATRLGEQAVLRCRLQREAQPEKAYVSEPLVGSNPPPLKGGARGGIPDRSSTTRSSSRNRRRTSPNLSPKGRGVFQGFAPLDRPPYLLRRPAPLETISIIPEGPPVQFLRAGRRHTVARHWGPERIETGWWRGQPAWRDYYRIETTAGRRYWLFRRRHDGKWFLHGIFG